ncbi:MAG: PRC-barrel domain-containing protein [Porcipelethomonas sp.]
MICSLSELKCKEVVNIKDGEILGYIDDIEFEPETGKIIAFIIFGRKRMYGLLGKEKDIVISCEQIKLIGKDAVLVSQENVCGNNYTKSKIFNIDNLCKNSK